MTILDEILQNKTKEVELRKAVTPIAALERRPYFNGPTISLRKYVERANGLGVIAEVKRRSPSKGIFKHNLNVEEITISYMQHGAAALSILTDSKYFGGSHADLETARQFNFCPVLCKDFIIDEYQIVEARAYGADVILLIASVLSKSAIVDYTNMAHSLGLEVIVEINSVEELNTIQDLKLDHLGVNCRDLKDFSCSLDRSFMVAQSFKDHGFPDSVSMIAESGIRGPADITALNRAGFRAFLIGELFMTANDPGKACGLLIEGSKELITKAA